MERWPRGDQECDHVKGIVQPLIKSNEEGMIAHSLDHKGWKRPKRDTSPALVLGMGGGGGASERSAGT